MAVSSLRGPVGCRHLLIVSFYPCHVGIFSFLLLGFCSVSLWVVDVSCLSRFSPHLCLCGLSHFKASIAQRGIRVTFTLKCHNVAVRVRRKLIKVDANLRGCPVIVTVDLFKCFIAPNLVQFFCSRFTQLNFPIAGLIKFILMICKVSCF